MDVSNSDLKAAGNDNKWRMEVESHESTDGRTGGRDGEEVNWMRALIWKTKNRNENMRQEV